METRIKCPKCNHEFDVTSAISTKVSDELEKKYEKRLSEEMKIIEEERNKLSELKQKEQEKIEGAVREKLKSEKLLMEKEFEQERQIQLNSLHEELEKKSEQLKEFYSLKAELSKMEREKNEMEGKIKAAAEAELNVKLQSQLQVQKAELLSENELKIKELEKKLSDQMDLTEEMRRKQNQGSQQAQGETQELILEEFLKDSFPLDEVEEVAKGKKGADALHVVKTKFGETAGKILYESKRTINFGNDWISKLKEDAKEAKADIAVLVTAVFPKGVERMTMIDGVWVCSLIEFRGICHILRESILKFDELRGSQVNREEKMHKLYDYLTGEDFRRKVETIVDGFKKMQADLQKEKTLMNKLWNERQVNIDKVLTSTAGMYGTIQAISNNSAQKIDSLEIQEELNVLPLTDSK
jgi:hypothetical protein